METKLNTNLLGNFNYLLTFKMALAIVFNVFHTNNNIVDVTTNTKIKIRLFKWKRKTDTSTVNNQ
jgi:hypothetical protein